MKSSLEGFKKVHKIKNCGLLTRTLYSLKYEDTLQPHPLHASIATFRLLGRMPLSIKSGKFFFNIHSWWTLYCLVSMTTQLGFGVYVFNSIFSKQNEWSSFDHTVNTLLTLSILLTLPHPVLFTWRKSSNIAEALNDWAILQRSFQVVTGSSVSSMLLEHPYCGVFLISLYTISVEFLPTAVNYFRVQKESPDPLIIIVYCLTVWYVKLVLWFWLVYTHSVSQAAKLLKKSLAKTMARDPSVRKLQQHRSLWLELHDYTCTMTAAVGSTVRAWLVINIISFSLSVYASGASFVSDGPLKIVTFMPLVGGGLPVFLMNNASFLADDQVGRDFIVKLLSFNYFQLSENQLDEVELFLCSIENSPERFLLEGMVGLSRRTVLDILETTLTMMVVLLQFRVSA